jgi:hypothetical protein
MRTAGVQSTVTENPYNAINLENGFFHYFNNDYEVTPVEAQLVVS